jgi:hypothetical protein
MLTAWLGSFGGAVWYGFKRFSALELRVGKIEDNVAHLGTLQQAQLQEIKDLVLDVRDRLTNQEDSIREFWRDRWPEVESQIVRIDGVEKTIDDIRDDIRAIRERYENKNG